MARRPEVVLNPRKTPVQARSSASVDAILQATVQVLLQVGKEKLTTTRVASRAGVSVGTLYQYFPNKSALLQAALRRHMNEVANTVDRVCVEQKGKSLTEMVTALVNTFLDTKMRYAATSVALYSVSSDVDGLNIVRKISERSNRAIVAMLESAAEPLTKEARTVADVLQGAMAGISRRLLESSAPDEELPRFRQELVELARAYVSTCCSERAQALSA